MNVVLLHGYSGSPKNFSELLDIFDGHEVIAPTLVGHKTCAKDLQYYSYQDFLAHAREIISSVEKPLVVGYSLGALLALDCADLDISGLVLIGAPLKMRFPYNSFVTTIAEYVRPLLNKDEVSERLGYDRVPVKGARLMREAARNVKRPEVDCVAFMCSDDFLIHQDSIDILQEWGVDVHVFSGGKTHDPLTKPHVRAVRREIKKLL